MINVFDICVPAGKVNFSSAEDFNDKKGEKNSEEVSKSKASCRCEILREVLEEQKILNVFGDTYLEITYLNVKTVEISNLKLPCIIPQKFVCHANWSKYFFIENAETKRFIRIIGLKRVNRLLAPLIIVISMQDSQT